MLWSAAITSVIGSAYTSVTFLKSFHPWLEKNQRVLITVFILISSSIFSWVGKPVKVLLWAGACNGIILPLSLGILLLATWRQKIAPGYKHPLWMSVAGWLVVILMAVLSIDAIRNTIAGLAL